jgi:phytoene dehydrogenase-like protein
VRRRYDAVVIGAGPNGLVAAIEIARAGRSVLVLEAAPVAGGGMRTEALTLPGFRHDVCSSIHPLGIASPALRALPLAEHGVQWVHPDAPLAHPLDDGAVVLERSVDATAEALGSDGERWRSLTATVPAELIDDLLDPWSVPRHPVAMARFAAPGIRSALAVGRGFGGDRAAALLAGLAAHSVMPLDAPITAGVGLVLGGLAHEVGWPLVAGGSQSLADALVDILRGAGGEVRTGHRVASVGDLPPARAVLADTSPRGLAAILGGAAPERWARRVMRFRHGPGVFKVDWALDRPVPWKDPQVARAATVHVGGTMAEIARAEAEVNAGVHPERPFVLLAQTSRFDPTRAPDGRHTLWGYCHVPSGSRVDMTERVEAQIERFAPGFRDCIVARHTMDTVAMEDHDANYVGGDIGGGLNDLRQFVFRPTVSPRPWKLPVDDWYLCSSSIPPGGGVHGMCGRKAARSALRHSLR